MLASETFILNPKVEVPQFNLERVHTFTLEGARVDGEEVGGYGRGMVVEAVVEDLRNKDHFCTFSGKHGEIGSWVIFKIDMSLFKKKGSVRVHKIADIPCA
jgi:hypothetical protein